MQGILFEESSFLSFLFISCVLGGAAAWMTGRACALTWRPWQLALAYMIPLGFVVRYIHYVIPPNGTLVSLQFYIVDTIILVIFCLVGYRYTRVKQMIRQYGWMYEKTSPFTWGPKKQH